MCHCLSRITLGGTVLPVESSPWTSQIILLFSLCIWKCLSKFFKGIMPKILHFLKFVFFTKTLGGSTILKAVLKATERVYFQKHKLDFSSNLELKVIISSFYFMLGNKLSNKQHYIGKMRKTCHLRAKRVKKFYSIIYCIVNLKKKSKTKTKTCQLFLKKSS